MIVLSWISIVSITILGACRLLVPQFRVYPSNLVLFMFVGLWLIALCGILPTFGNGWRDLLCTNDAASPQSRGWCTFQGVLWFVGELTFSMYWAAIAIHSFLSVALRSEKFFTWKTAVLTHVLCWSWPILGIIVTASEVGFGVRPVIPFCFIEQQLYQWVFFWDCIIVMVAIGSACIIYLFWQMIRLDYNDEFHWHRHIRVLSFLLTFDLMWAVIIAYRIQAAVNSDFWQNLIKSFVGCSISSPTCVRGDAPPFAFGFVFIFFTFGTGAITTIFFAFNKRMWVAVFAVLRLQNPAAAIASMSETATTKSGTKTATQESLDGRSSFIESVN